eukprot:TRINITY_DN18399_c0_g1_i2.p1 TRINITY_DN18399_c0_g1~~TRINITY_DN18399_c0_g1_i2.p1  ORF type:complete len:189 (-),score=21.31 TRINITY_DN18399_c0_g1_i2:68-634(-)
MALYRETSLESEMSLETTLDIQRGSKHGSRKALLTISGLFMAAAAVVAVFAATKSTNGSTTSRSLLVYTVCSGDTSPTDCEICMRDSNGNLANGCSEPTYSCACVGGSMNTPVGCKPACQRASSFTNCIYGIGDQQPADRPMDQYAGGVLTCTQQLLSGIYVATLSRVINFFFKRRQFRYVIGKISAT